MARIFRHHVSPVKLTLAIADVALITGSAFLAEWLRWHALDLELVQNLTAFVAKLAIPIITFPLLLGFGAYQSDALSDLRIFFFRTLAAMATSLFVLAAIAYLLPALPLWRSILVLSFILAAGSVFLLHILFILFATDSFLGRRVLILGAGKDALALKKEAEATPEAALKIVDIVALGDAPVEIDTATRLADINLLPGHVASLECELIVIGEKFDKQPLPVEALIACKLAGVQIMDRLTFFEEVRGYVDLESVKADWIIFAEGFRGGSLLERGAKRLMDVLVAVVFLILASPILLLAAVAVKLTSAGPVLYL